ncbi:NAD(P)/FAD-dependent oxidoreductase [Haloplasma contractile]|uniref:Heterodisulfide reductase protein n=1 Tax=Haloplasma contractile SSD-17B TaxID=1033810 RepID=U2ECG0_9MOLU|nr:FAD-dependent oxidoreductase [Haloplasma contractile]ERJ12456.1 Heterodisulfide reductase protein [Haloplasma contractile SSD-17B]
MRKVADQCLWKKDIENNQYTKLEKDIDTEVLIIGGGVTGALTAYTFFEKGIDATLIEKGNIAMDSTLASTSILHYEIDTDLQRLKGFVGEDHAIEAFRRTLDAVYTLDRITDDLDDKCEFVRRPSFYYTNRHEDYEYVFDEYKVRKESGFDVDFLDGNDDHEKYSFSFASGIFSYNSGAEVNPVKLTNELLRHCYKKGMRIYEKTEAIEFNLENKEPMVVTRDGYKIKAKKIILACGYDTLAFVDQSLFNMTRTFVLSTKPVENFEGWFSRSLIRDADTPYTYIRTTVDNRIIIGGEDITVTPNDHDKLYMEDNHELAKHKYKILEKKLEEMFPSIKDKDIEFKFNGLFVETDDGLPYFGEHDDYPNMYFNLGVGSNGLLYGLIGAEELVNYYLNDEPIKPYFQFNR